MAHFGHLILYLALTRGSDSQIEIDSAQVRQSLCEQFNLIGNFNSFLHNWQSIFKFLFYLKIYQILFFYFFFSNIFFKKKKKNFFKNILFFFNKKNYKITKNNINHLINFIEFK